MSKHSVTAGDVAGLMKQFADLRRKAEPGPVRAIRSSRFRSGAGWVLAAPWFWQQNGIESHVVDPASIATPRRRRRVKTDRLDGEALLRALLAYKRGEPRVCAMVVAPSPEEEDRRRICRERQSLIAERITHVNRIKVFCSRKDLRFTSRCGATGGRGSRPCERATGGNCRRIEGADRPRTRSIELLLEQVKAVRGRTGCPAGGGEKACKRRGRAGRGLDAARLEGNGANFAAVLWSEAFYRQFSNRRQVAAYAGLAADALAERGHPHEQGVSKAGNPGCGPRRSRSPGSDTSPAAVALTRWFKERSPQGRKRAIVALARKLSWRCGSMSPRASSSRGP